MHLIDALAKMQLTASNASATCVPFSAYNVKMTLYKGDAALAARRAVASKLDHSAISALRRPMHVDKPDWSLMQQLSDAGIGVCFTSGMPVLDPSACAPGLRTAIWRAYCGVASSVNTKQMGQTDEALDELQMRLHEHAAKLRETAPRSKRLARSNGTLAKRSRGASPAPSLSDEGTDTGEPARERKLRPRRTIPESDDELELRPMPPVAGSDDTDDVPERSPAPSLSDEGTDTDEPATRERKLRPRRVIAESDDELEPMEPVAGAADATAAPHVPDRDDFIGSWPGLTPRRRANGLFHPSAESRAPCLPRAGSCSGCGGPTPYCAACGVAYCAWCEPGECEVPLAPAMCKPVKPLPPSPPPSPPPPSQECASLRGRSMASALERFEDGVRVDAAGKRGRRGGEPSASRAATAAKLDEEGDVEVDDAPDSPSAERRGGSAHGAIALELAGRPPLRASAPTFEAWPWGHSATEWAANELAWLPRRVCDERESPSAAWRCAGQYADSDSGTDDSDREDAGDTEKEEEHSQATAALLMRLSGSVERMQGHASLGDRQRALDALQHAVSALPDLFGSQQAFDRWASRWTLAGNDDSGTESDGSLPSLRAATESDESDTEPTSAACCHSHGCAGCHGFSPLRSRRVVCGETKRQTEGCSPPFQVFFRDLKGHHGTLDGVRSDDTASTVLCRIAAKLGLSEAATSTLRLIKAGKALDLSAASLLAKGDTVHVLSRLDGGIRIREVESASGAALTDAPCATSSDGDAEDASDVANVRDPACDDREDDDDDSDDYESDGHAPGLSAMLHGMAELTNGRVCIAGSYALHHYLRVHRGVDEWPSWTPGDIDIFYCPHGGELDGDELRRRLVDMARCCQAEMSRAGELGGFEQRTTTCYPAIVKRDSEDVEDAACVAAFAREQLTSLCSRERPREREYALALGARTRGCVVAHARSCAPAGTRSARARSSFLLPHAATWTSLPSSTSWRWSRWGSLLPSASATGLRLACSPALTSCSARSRTSVATTRG